MTMNKNQVVFIQLYFALWFGITFNNVEMPLGNTLSCREWEEETLGLGFQIEARLSNTSPTIKEFAFNLAFI